MAKYLLIDSRDVFESRDAANWYGLARDLKDAGNEVTVFLVQNGVLALRAGASCKDFDRLLEAKIDVLADDFSLRERGIAADRMVDGVKPAPLDVVVDHLADGCQVIWH